MGEFIRSVAAIILMLVLLGLYCASQAKADAISQIITEIQAMRPEKSVTNNLKSAVTAAFAADFVHTGRVKEFRREETNVLLGREPLHHAICAYFAGLIAINELLVDKLPGSWPEIVRSGAMLTEIAALASSSIHADGVEITLVFTVRF